MDGNILVGPNAVDVDDRYDTRTTAEGQQEVFRGARLSVPSLSEKSVITSFAGVRAVSDKDDFIIGFSKVDGLLNVAGICSPGLTAAPATAEYVVSLLEKKGLLGKKKKDFCDSRKTVRFMKLSDEEKLRALKKNPLYGRIICRCESVTEGEIVDSIRGECGAVSLDGVKRRVRAGMGRCQGGFCSPRVMEILSRERGIAFTDVTKAGGKSWLTEKKDGSDD